MDEFGAISQYLSPLSSGYEGAFGLTDDAAIFPAPKGHWVISTDTVVEGVHFFSNNTHKQMLHRAMGSSLSDLAAMGAQPKFFLCNSTIPKEMHGAFMQESQRVLEQYCKDYTMHLLGGDTTTGKCRVLSITVIGALQEDEKPIRRQGAKVGDTLWVTETIGAGALGLCIEEARQGIKEYPWIEELSTHDKENLVHHYYNPMPRIAVGRELQKIANAGIDISDGLLADVAHMARASHVVMEIDVEKIPYAQGVKKALHHDAAVLEKVLTGGDDYELVVSIPQENEKKIQAIQARTGIKLTAIGCVVAHQEHGKTPHQDIILKGMTEGGIKKRGYTHF